MDCLPQLHLAAIHDVAGYRGDTTGLGLICRRPVSTWEDGLVGAGRFRNSVAGYSNYAAVGHQPWRLGSVRLGGFAGVINGYQYRNGGYFPFAAAMASVPVPFGEVHAVALPATSFSPTTFEISIAIKF